MLFSFIKHKRAPIDQNDIRPIKQLLDRTWDLSKTFTALPGSRNGEAIDTFNHFFLKLNQIVTSILKNVVALASLAPDLEAFSLDFKRKTGEQEEKITGISRAASDMAGRIEKIAQNSQDVSDDTLRIEMEVKEAFKLGTHSMENYAVIQSAVKALVETITVLEKHSNAIASIIDVINGISDETNILSLNARIEAAKNTSENKGFKVIAEEISALAKQSKTATQEIKDQLAILGLKINETVSCVKTVEANVQSGETLIADANRSLENVHHHIGHLSGNMTRIKESMSLQSGDVKAVSRDISTIEQSVALQSREVENIFKASQQINTTCDDMIVDTGIFHLSGHQKAGKTAQDLATDARILSFDQTGQEAALETCLSDHPFIELAYITDKAGKQVTRNIYSPHVMNSERLDTGIGKDWSGKNWFQGPAKTGAVFISNVYRSSATRQFCFTVSAPIFSNHAFTGVLGIDINFKDMLTI